MGLSPYKTYHYKKHPTEAAVSMLANIRDSFDICPVSIYADPCYTGFAKVGLKKWNFEAELSEYSHPDWKYLIKNFHLFAPVAEEMGLVVEKLDVEESIFVLNPKLEAKRAKAAERKLARLPEESAMNVRAAINNLYKK